MNLEDTVQDTVTNFRVAALALQEYVDATHLMVVNIRRKQIRGVENVRTKETEE